MAAGAMEQISTLFTVLMDKQPSTEKYIINILLILQLIIKAPPEKMVVPTPKF
jgi:hypothetical protein